MPEETPKPKTLAFSRTKAFRRFQGKVGNATYRLNTIFVGLEHISAGQGKLPGGIAVTWEAPEPKHAKQVADQARSFACLAATALAADVVDEYLTDLASETWLKFSAETNEILNKSKTRPSTAGGAYGLHERAKAAADELGLNEPIHSAMLELQAKWRNASIHSRDKEITLSDETAKTFDSKKKDIAKSFSNLDIDLAQRNFKAKQVPVGKEITSLIASAQNFFRKIDEAAVRRALPNQGVVEEFFLKSLRQHFVDKDDNLIKSRLNDYFANDVEERQKSLLKIIQAYGLTQTSTPVSPSLPIDVVEIAASWNEKQLAEHLATEDTKR
ncbi:MAG: hypothetical protein EOO23_03725 [Comamonadaceae bacterium]|nr:MAG: hypothetical protein EOO23_03725 [Comamonadaceae bacterium]